jgi:hypothetical protein
MVGTLTTFANGSSSTPLHIPGSEDEGPHVELSELTSRPGSCRGVTPHASDWLSRLERRDGAYLPI